MKSLVPLPLIAGLMLSTVVRGEVVIARQGKAACVILEQAGATPTELYAAKELARTLRRVTGAKFEPRMAGETAPPEAILVGPGSLARELFPEVPFKALGPEELVIRSSKGRLLLAGGRPRGTLYAVERFLEKECGVRWWTPWASSIPRHGDLSFGKLDIREKPAFEYREPYWYPAFDAKWAVRHFYNGMRAPISSDMGGRIEYKGFVHTAYPLVPPSKYFKLHPEWYSLVDGKRRASHAQLCLTNPKLRDFVVRRVRQWLEEAPNARIISISQNDCAGACQCGNCAAIDQAEGSHAGTMLAFVNYVAGKLGKEFPNVAFDTLAYQYTRHPPRTLRPLPNVIVRLCSIECDFAVPLTAPRNKSFARDLRQWSKICHRLYVWDYCTDFAHYVQPFPNWFSLGPNLRFFRRNHVKGIFEEGAYQSDGAEMAGLRAWLLSRLMWNPDQDDQALIREYIEGYYGRPGAPFIERYLHLMSGLAKDYHLGCFAPTDGPFFKFKPMLKAESLWRKAEAASEANPEEHWRVAQGHLPLVYVWLARWGALRKECRGSGGQWPFSKSKAQVAQDWLALATGPGPRGWTPLTQINESGMTPQAFVNHILRVRPEPLD